MRPTCTASDSSWPGLSRPSTPFSRRFSKQGGDGRDIRAFTQEPVEDGRGRPDVFDGLLPGHDQIGTATQLRYSPAAVANTGLVTRTAAPDDCHVALMPRLFEVSP